MNKLIHRIKEKWGEKGFQKYFRNTGWMFVARLFGMFLAFFVTAIVARYLGPERYGTLMYAISFVGLFSFLASLGIDQILYREIIKNPEKESELLGTSFVLKIIGGLIATLITILISYFFINDLLEKKLIFIISLSFVFQSINVINYSFQSRLENKKITYITIITTIILSLLKIIVVFSNKGILFLSGILVLEPVIYGIFFIYYYSKYFGNIKSWNFNTNTAKNIIKWSAPLMLSTVFVLIYSRIDQVMLKYYLDSRAVGLYSSAVTLSEIWYFIPGIVVISLFPSIINARENNKYIYNKRILKLTCFMVIISIMISIIGTIFARDILHLVFGLKFIDAYRVLQIYIWSSIGISIGTVLNQYLIAEKLSSTILYISIVGMIINVLLNFLLIGKYGINGSALATLISYTAGPLSVFCFKKARVGILQLLKNN
jgi:O-antigen/teichoic acid export membrane protein